MKFLRHTRKHSREKNDCGKGTLFLLFTRKCHSIYLLCYKRIMFKHFTTSFYGPWMHIPILKVAEMRTQAYTSANVSETLCYAVCISSSSSSQILNGLFSVHLRQLHFSSILILPFLVWLVICVRIFFLYFSHAFFSLLCVVWLFSLIYSRFHE